MPSQVRIIRERNSPQWDALVRKIIDAGRWRKENVYGGITKPERADKVRRSIRTAAKHNDVASLVRYIDCPDPGHCSFGNDCAYHVLFTIFTIEEGRQYKAQQAQTQARNYR